MSMSNSSTSTSTAGRLQMHKPTRTSFWRKTTSKLIPSYAQHACQLTGMTCPMKKRWSFWIHLKNRPNQLFDAPDWHPAVTTWSFSAKFHTDHDAYQTALSNHLQPHLVSTFHFRRVCSKPNKPKFFVHRSKFLKNYSTKVRHTLQTHSSTQDLTITAISTDALQLFIYFNADTTMPFVMSDN